VITIKEVQHSGAEITKDDEIMENRRSELAAIYK
jgi:hypothetical protein